MSELQPPKRRSEQQPEKIVKHKSSSSVKSFFSSDLFTVGGFDIPFFALTIALLTIGLICLFSASYPYALQKYNDSYYFFKHQLVFAILGVVVMLLVSKMNYKAWIFFEKGILAVSLILLVVVLFYHTNVDDFKRWMRIGPITVQPSDIAKFSLILSMSVYVSKYHKKMKNWINGIVIPVLFIGVFCGLIALEHHMSCTILVFLMGATIMFAGGTDWRLFAVGAGIILAVGIVVVLNPNMLLDYNAERITAWLDKTYEPLGARWQTNNSLYAIGSGGLFGVGLGNSKQKYLYVSEPQNDFIFSIVCEELGFIRVVLLLVLFALLFYRGIKIALRVHDKFGSFLVIGIVSQIAIQTIFNVLVVTDTIPNTGISLPFFSSGGTAILMLLFECGVVLSVSRKANQKTV